MPKHNPHPPKIEFLRELMPPTTAEIDIAAEEARLIRFMGLIEHIMVRLEREADLRKEASADSTQSELDSML
tara:strand:- start:30970 stop:31185 length:216 start_codon:yes stop_codon:yes gene_type:complete